MDLMMIHHNEEMFLVLVLLCPSLNRQVVMNVDLPLTETSCGAFCGQMKVEIVDEIVDKSLVHASRNNPPPTYWAL
jgi:hypothetical protein